MKYAVGSFVFHGLQMRLKFFFFVTIFLQIACSSQYLFLNVFEIILSCQKPCVNGSHGHQITQLAFLYEISSLLSHSLPFLPEISP